MKSLRLTVEHTDATIHPVHEFVCTSAAVDRELLLMANTTTDPATFLFYVEGDRDRYEAALSDVDRIAEYDITPSGDGFFVYAREHGTAVDRAIYEAFQRETVVTVPPVEFLPDRTMRLTLIGHPEQLQAAIDDLPAALGVRVDRIGEYTGRVGGTLTDRQREAVRVARELGYYEVPRETDLGSVAAALDCTPATASTLLRKAEARLVDGVLGETNGDERSVGRST